MRVQTARGEGGLFVHRLEVHDNQDSHTVVHRLEVHDNQDSHTVDVSVGQHGSCPAGDREWATGFPNTQ